ncbi:glycine zipper domain-containing protein [Arenibacterium sp. LLYu02]|uniref:glycine zipper domain-containing protein n=1 Tax=Arenibacterium sp. LLYu02 TaxID=3404132 RepID=UPI003B2238FE
MPKDITAPTAEDIAAQLEVLRTDMVTLTHSVSELAKDRAAKARDAARDTAKAQGQAIADGAAQMTRQAEDAVRAQPLAATAIAAGLGFAVGYLSNRR